MQQRVSKSAVRLLAVTLAAGLALVGCSSEAYENQPGGVGVVIQDVSS